MTIGHPRGGFCHAGRAERGKVGTLRTARDGRMLCGEAQHQERSHVSIPLSGTLVHRSFRRACPGRRGGRPGGRSLSRAVSLGPVSRGVRGGGVSTTAAWAASRRGARRRTRWRGCWRAWVLFDTRYWDFTAKHFHEKLVADHGFKRSYNWLRLSLQAHGRRRAAPRRGAHRRKRPRRARSPA